MKHHIPSNIWFSYIPVLFTSKKKTNKHVSIHGKSLTAHSKTFSKNSWGWNPFLTGHRDDVAQVFNTWLLMETNISSNGGLSMGGMFVLGHAPNKKKCSSRHEVRGVCVFDGLCWCFLLISPVVLTSVDHKGRSKSIAFLLVFSCPIDKDFLIQFLIVQQVLKTNP